MVVVEVYIASLEAAEELNALLCTARWFFCPLGFSRPNTLRPFRENHLRQEDGDRSGMTAIGRMEFIETAQVRWC
jgi:hypothetical protein